MQIHENINNGLIFCLGGGLSLPLNTPMRINFLIPVACKDLFLNVVLIKTANYNSGLNRYYGHSTGNE